MLSSYLHCVHDFSRKVNRICLISSYMPHSIRFYYEVGQYSSMRSDKTMLRRMTKSSTKVQQLCIHRNVSETMRKRYFSNIYHQQSLAIVSMKMSQKFCRIDIAPLFNIKKVLQLLHQWKDLRNFAKKISHPYFCGQQRLAIVARLSIYVDKITWPTHLVDLICHQEKTIVRQCHFLSILR